MHTMLAPGQAVMSRLSVIQKLILTAVALALPLPIITWAYLDTQGSQIDFSAKERVGVRYLTPLLPLVADISAARTAVATGQSATDVSFDEVTVAEKADGAELATSEQFAALSTAVSALDGSTGTDAVAAYDTAIAAAIDLITQVANESNLILDPDLDSYYLMDSLVARLPKLEEAAARVGSLQTNAAFTRDDLDAVRNLAVANADLVAGLEAVDSNYETTFAKTSDQRLAKSLAEPLRHVAERGAELRGANSADAVAAADALVAAVSELADASNPALDQLLTNADRRSLVGPPPQRGARRNRAGDSAVRAVCVPRRLPHPAAKGARRSGGARQRRLHPSHPERRARATSWPPCRPSSTELPTGCS